ncbi:golgin subfamily A member 6-like protein 1 [Chanodichthys erythropterus]|uniref:golgin subfamily A member 6-like protein 1 n=1 Tax=Chanodichthys erythropterus TaxID=933992 RepID=UPI00351DE275
MKALVCILLLLETFVFVVQQQVDGGLNKKEISQQISSEDGRQNPPQTDTLRAEASTDRQQYCDLGIPDIHAALRELTATVTEQKEKNRELTATVTEQKENIRELTATVTEQKENIRELTTTVTEQKENIRELTATVTEQKENIRELTATVTEQKENIRELTTTVTEQKENIRELTTTVTEQKENIRELTATVTEQKENIRELTATVTEQKENIRELTATVTEQKEKNRALETQQTFILEELKKKNEEISNLTLSQVELRKENRAFSASMMESGSGNIGPFTSDITLTYKNVFTNIGNAYNPITGIFTAPLKGAYMFRVSVFSHAPPSTAAVIVKNGKHVVVADDKRPQNDLNASNGVVLILEVGDVVYVRLWAGRRIFDNQNNHNTFSGYLLFPLK